MIKDYNIIVFTKQKEFFYSFLKYLISIESPNNPCLIDSEDNLNWVKMPQIELIICDTEINEKFIDLSFQILNNHPNFIPVILMVSNRSWSEFSKALTCATAILDPINMWSTNWGIISTIQNMWKSPCLKVIISEATSSDILQMIGNNRWTAGVRFMDTYMDNNYKGCIFFKNGVAKYAWSTNELGSKAVFEMLKLQRGILDVVKDMDLLYLKNIHLSIEEILLVNALESDTPDVPKNSI